MRMHSCNPYGNILTSLKQAKFKRLLRKSTLSETNVKMQKKVFYVSKMYTHMLKLLASAYLYIQFVASLGLITCYSLSKEVLT